MHAPARLFWLPVFARRRRLSQHLFFLAIVLDLLDLSVFQIKPAQLLTKSCLGEGGNKSTRNSETLWRVIESTLRSTSLRKFSCVPQGLEATPAHIAVLLRAVVRLGNSAIENSIEAAPEAVFRTREAEHK